MGRPRRSVDKFGRQNSVNHALCHRTANASGTHPTARKTALLKQKARLSETPYGKLGRSERIRTSDPLLPKQVRYQAALRSDRGRGLTGVIPVCKRGSWSLMHLLLRSATLRNPGPVIAALWRAEKPREMCQVITTAARLHIAAHQRASPICPRGSAHEAHTPPPIVAALANQPRTIHRHWRRELPGTVQNSPGSISINCASWICSRKALPGSALRSPERSKKCRSWSSATSI